MHIPYLQKSNPSVLPTFAMFTARQRFSGWARGGQSCFSHTRIPKPAVVPPRPAVVPPGPERKTIQQSLDYVSSNSTGLTAVASSIGLTGYFVYYIRGLEDKYALMAEKLESLEKVSNEKLVASEKVLLEKMKSVEVSAELKSTENYLKYSQSAEYKKLRHKGSLPQPSSLSPSI